LLLEHSPARQRRRSGKRRNAKAPPDNYAHLNNDDLRVLTTREFAALIGTSLITVKRLLKAGQAPVVTRLSPGRIGFRRIDIARWQEHRARSA
jgi:predicted DNA-binding transcriptional regulator AlpA